MKGVKVGPIKGSTAPLTGFDPLMVPNHNFLLFAFKCYYQRVFVDNVPFKRSFTEASLFLLLKEILST